MRALLLAPLLASATPAFAADAAAFRLPAFPAPTFVLEGSSPVEIGAVRLVRELHRGGLRSTDKVLDLADADYALLRSDSLGYFAGWLERATEAVGAKVQASRRSSYDGTVFARLLSVVSSLAVLRDRGPRLAVPIGVVACTRRAAWGELPADGREDAYVVFVTEAGIVVYDPPTRQIAPLAEFPNRDSITRIRI
jgi:hypothetical protein